jgi:hypothetical protein
MKLPNDCTLTYIVGYEAWYADANRLNCPRPYLGVHATSHGGGVAWEFEVQEYDLDGPTVRLNMFADSFDAFTQVSEFFTMLTLQKPSTLADVRSILHYLGAEDRTERVRS